MTQVLEAYCATCETSWPSALEECPNDGTQLVRLSKVFEDRVGTLFGDRFKIRSHIGDGGMGTVYEAVDELQKREVALKVVHRRLSDDLGAAKRFLREAKLTSSLHHPNIVEVYDYGQTQDQVLYLTMELIKGQPLELHLQKQRRLTAEAASAIAREVLLGLASAHKAGIVHRDIKPSNILLSKKQNGDTRVVVLDFGLARSLGTPSRTTPGFIVGTPAYLAPEVARQGRANAQSDLYAIGVLLYELVSGKVPFDAEDPYSVLSAHVNERPPPLGRSVPASLGKFIFRLLEKVPRRRYPSADHAIAALDTVLDVLRDPHGLAETVPIPAFDAAMLAGAPPRRAAGKRGDRPKPRPAKTLTMIRALEANPEADTDPQATPVHAQTDYDTGETNTATLVEAVRVDIDRDIEALAFDIEENEPSSTLRSSTTVRADTVDPDE